MRARPITWLDAWRTVGGYTGLWRLSGLALVLSAAAGLLGGCDRELAVALTIVADERIADSALPNLRRLDLRVSGAEEECLTYELEGGFGPDRTERLIYRPQVAKRGELQFTVSVSDGATLLPPGYGTGSVRLVADRPHTASVALGPEIPTDALVRCDAQPGECDDGNSCTVGKEIIGPTGKVCRYAPAPEGTVCRLAPRPCDVAERCDGRTMDCPADVLARSGVECRPAAGPCDVAEHCDGQNAACPMDALAGRDVKCRVAERLCDVAEYCTGLSSACPDDRWLPQGTECRAALDVCDVAEVCTGASPDCPPDGRAEVCEQLLVNGDFEKGRIGWTFMGGSDVFRDESCQGGLSNVLCAQPGCNGATEQTIILPPDASVDLRFSLQITPLTTVPALATYEAFFVEVLSLNGELLRTVFTVGSDESTSCYQKYGPIDLAGFAAQTVRLRFRAATDSASFITYRLDDVSVSYN